MSKFLNSFNKADKEEFVFSYYVYEKYLKTKEEYGSPRRYMQLLNNKPIITVSDKLGYILYDGQVFGIIPEFCIKISKKERI